MSKCIGCKKDNISIFPWLAGKNYCDECTKPVYDFFILEKMEAQKTNPKIKQKTTAKPKSFQFYSLYVIVVLIFFGFIWMLFSVNEGDGHNDESCFYEYGTPGGFVCY